jgi:diguanylate cyclase (GGDEF)-like protein/PAS domain S-box-containing protein
MPTSTPTISPQPPTVESLDTHAILDSLLDPHLILAPLRDATGKIADFTIIESNAAAAEYYQLDHESMIGRSLLELLPADNASALMAMARDAHESGEPLVVNNYAIAFAIYGPERRFDIRAVRINGELIWTWRDVTERHLAAKSLVDSEERYRLLAENCSDVIARIRHGNILWISPSVFPTLGWSINECLGRKIEDFLENEDRRLCAERIAELQAGHTVRGRHHIRSKDGSLHWVETHASPYLNIEGHSDGFVATCRVIDEQVAAEQQLEHRTRTDALTNLLNRQEALSRIQSFGTASRRSGQEIAVLFCDLDHFKKINDHYGHVAGDEVLRIMADRLRNTLRTSDDLAARLGGDELLVLLHGVRDLDDAMALAKKILKSAAEPIFTADETLHVTMSIGVALLHEGQNTEDLIARADAAMYHAKKRGRNHVICLDE